MGGLVSKNTKKTANTMKPTSNPQDFAGEHTPEPVYLNSFTEPGLWLIDGEVVALSPGDVAIFCGSAVRVMDLPGRDTGIAP